MRRGDGFRGLWTAYSVTILGSAVALGALPYLALTVLDASAPQVSLMAALAAVASAVVAVPLAPLVERQPKRRVLMVAEWAQFAALASVVLAYAAGRLTFAHLCAVATVESAGAILYLAATGAYVKRAVAGEALVGANARLEATNWSAATLGPPLGGLLIAVSGALTTVVVNALSFVAGAVFLRRLPPEAPAVAARTAARGEDRRLPAGFRHILAHRGLRALYLNAMLFGGAVTMAAPLLAVLMLRDLHLSAWQYGLALGAPAAAGLLGSTLSPRLVARLGADRALVWSAAARGPWILLLPLAPAGVPGLVVVLASQSLLLLTAGLFNPVFATYRMRATPDHLMTRVSAAWSVSAKIAQPACIALGGWAAAVAGVRPALLLAGAACLAATAFLPGAVRRRSVPRP